MSLIKNETGDLQTVFSQLVFHISACTFISLDYTDSTTCYFCRMFPLSPHSIKTSQIQCQLSIPPSPLSVFRLPHHHIAKQTTISSETTVSTPFLWQCETKRHPCFATVIQEWQLHQSAEGSLKAACVNSVSLKDNCCFLWNINVGYSAWGSQTCRTMIILCSVKTGLFMWILIQFTLQQK